MDVDDIKMDKSIFPSQNVLRSFNSFLRYNENNPAVVAWSVKALVSHSDSSLCAGRWIESHPSMMY